MTTTDVHNFAKNSFFSNIPLEKISVNYKLDDENEICDLLIPLAGITTLRDMIKDNN